MSFLPLRLFWIATMLATGFGCGNSVEVATGGAGTSGNAQTVGDVNPLTSSSTGGKVCGGFDDAKSTAPVTLHFLNQSGVPIFLPGNCTDVAYTITPPGGPDGIGYASDRSCLQTCSVLQTEPQIFCGACQSKMYRLDPGGTRDVVFDGTGLESTTMPGSCWKNPPQGSAQCEQIVLAPKGTYQVDILGYASCGPNCQCDAQGVCTDASGTGATAYPNPTQINMGVDAFVPVVFGPCSFPCPN